MTQNIGKVLKDTSQKSIQMAKNIIKRHLISLSIREMQNKIAMGYNVHPPEWLKLSKQYQILKTMWSI